PNIEELLTSLIALSAPSSKPTPADVANEKINSPKLITKLDGQSLLDAYRQFCKAMPVANSTINFTEFINYYDSTLDALPDVGKLKDLKLPQSTQILDRKGGRFTEVYSDNGRRIFVPIDQIPESVRNAFVAAEDKNFFKHTGIDIKGVVRAFGNTLSNSGSRPQGGSTITQ